MQRKHFELGNLLNDYDFIKNRNIAISALKFVYLLQ